MISPIVRSPLRRWFGFVLLPSVLILGQCLLQTAPFSYLYVSNAGDNDVSAFKLDLDGGTLAMVSGSPFSLNAGSSPAANANAITTNPAGTYVFVAEFTAGKVGAYAISSSGALSPVTNSPFTAGTNTYDVRVDPSGAWLYAANDGDKTVSGYSINPGSGALSALPHSPYSTGTDPLFTAVTPSGQYVFVVNSVDGTVSRYSITASGGNAGDLVSLGTATSVDTVPTDPDAVIVDPSGKFLYTANSGTDNVSGFSIDMSGGLSGLTNSPYSTGTLSAPVFLAVDPMGRFLYVADGGTNKISAFTIGGSGPSAGTLTEIAGSPFAAGTNPDAVAVDPTGKWLIAANGGSNNLSVYRITQSGPNAGALTPAGLPVSVGAGPSGVTITPRQ